MEELNKGAEEYLMISREIFKLKGKGIEDRERHLIIGAGIVLGSRKAYEQQNEEGRKGYWTRAIDDQAEEAGIIAEEIGRLAVNGHLPAGKLEEVLEMGIKREGKGWQRPYGIIGTGQPYEERGLMRLGKYIEKKFERSKEGEGTLGRAKGEEEWQFKKRVRIRQLREKEKLTKYLREYFG